MTRSVRLRDLPASYWRLCVSHGISSFGDFLRMTTITFWAYEASGGSAAAVGAFVTTELLVAMLSGSIAGWIADRRDRLKTMIASDFGRLVTGLILVAAVVGDNIPVALIAVGASGFLTSLFDTCRTALLPSVLHPALLATGNNVMITVEQIAVVASPGAAAVLYETLGAAPALTIDAASFLVSGLLLIRLRYRHATPPDPSPDSRATASANGRRWLPLMAIAAAVLVCASYQFGVNSSALVAFLPENLGHPVTDVFWFALTSGAIQLFAGTLLSVVAHRLRLNLTMVISAAIVMFGGWVLAVAPNLLIAVIGVGLIASANIPFRVAFETLPQLTVPSRLLGRVSGAIRSAKAASYVVGTMGGGLIADQSTPRASLTTSAVVLSVGAVISLGLLAPYERLSWRFRQVGPFG